MCFDCMFPCPDGNIQAEDPCLISMILLKNVRLVNWYAFNNNTFPVGHFTLIMGRNGSGKSVILDAIRYGAFGDTVFNKSTDTPGKRTLPTYTRGFMDATSNTFMRPVEKVRNVTTHIVLEYLDELTGEEFLLGTLIETDSKNSTKTWRYVMENRSLASVDHTYTENGVTKPKTREMLKKEYQVRFMANEEGIERFMRKTGMNLTKQQTQVFLKKIHGILTYNPKSRIEQFIRESVLEPREVRFGPLIESMEKIGALNQELSRIGEEITDLETVAAACGRYEELAARIQRDDILRAYRDYCETDGEITELSRKQSAARRQIGDIKDSMKKKGEEERELERRIRQANLSLDTMDCMEPIRMETEHQEDLQAKAAALLDKKKQLEKFQASVSEALALLADHGVKVKDKDILASLGLKQYSAMEKEQAVESLKEELDGLADRMAAECAGLASGIETAAKEAGDASNIISDCDRKQNSFSQIPGAYPALKSEINAEFKKRGLPGEAKFACEYVSGLKDEGWRNALEAFLGQRRYTILVEPEYYDMAFAVFRKSKNKGAHLFNTKLLMKRTIHEEDGSAAALLDVQGVMARKYFSFLLGRMKAVPTEDVPGEENAISKDGCVSVAMDTYYLQFDWVRGYFLGRDAMELNKARAEKSLEAAMAKREKLMEEKRAAAQARDDARQYARIPADLNYSANAEYADTVAQIRTSMQALEQLKRAQKDNQEFNRMEAERERLDGELTKVRDEKQKLYSQVSDIEAKIAVWGGKADEKQEQLEEAENRMDAYRDLFPAETACAMEEYDRQAEAGKKASSLVMAKAAREEAVQALAAAEEEVKQGQYSYNARWAMREPLPVGTREYAAYAARKERIWMDDLQGVKEKLAAQKEKYESDFRTEFVLRIYTACVDAQREITRMNHKLAKLNFKEQYQFEVVFRDDGSDFAKIIDYARYVSEAASGQVEGQISMAYPEGRAEELEADIKQIVRGLVESGSEDAIAQISDYRNYMAYDILINNAVFHNARLSRQTSYESGAEVQIPYMLILLSALLMSYDARENCTKLVFIDEPFTKMDPGNVKLMLDFMKEHHLQMLFCAPDKVDLIGNECEVVLPVLKVRPDVMKIGSIRFHGWGGKAQ